MMFTFVCIFELRIVWSMFSHVTKVKCTLIFMVYREHIARLLF